MELEVEGRRPVSRLKKKQTTKVSEEDTSKFQEHYGKYGRGWTTLEETHIKRR